MQKDVRKHFMSEGRHRREVNRLISLLARVNLVYGFTAITQHLYAFVVEKGPGATNVPYLYYTAEALFTNGREFSLGD